MRFPIGCRRCSGNLSEDFGKEAAAAEIQLITDFLNAQIRGSQQGFGFIHLDLLDIVIDADSHLLLEFAGEIVFGIADSSGNLRQGQLF